ncbi:hypothetical protein Tco_0357005 [Tanacetum coccineum]
MTQDNGDAYVEVQEDAGRASGVVGQGFRRRNTTIGARGYGSGSITLHEVIQDCMSPQPIYSSDEESDPPATHGPRSPTSKSFTK